MIRSRAIFLSAALILSACRPDVAAVPDPVPMTAEAVGHFCQMNLLEHEGPKAQVHLKSVMHPLFFSQVRDAIAYQRMPEQSDEIIGIYVNDMGAPGASWAAPGADNWILAGDAVYVTGSRQRGGMGAPELVPFSDPDKARAYIAQYGGQLRELSQILDSEVLGTADDSASDTAPATDAVPPDDGDYARRLRALTPGETQP